ncbi:hypothetical protein THO17_09220 [Marinomonas sp. THO17]
MQIEGRIEIKANPEYIFTPVSLALDNQWTQYEFIRKSQRSNQRIYPSKG